MKKTIALIPTAGVLAAVALGLAGPASADTPTTGTAADVVVQHLKDEGYSVQFNMPSQMALSRCTVSGLDGITVMMDPNGGMSMKMAPGTANSTVYVTLSCPNSNN
jgi:hypothetical protein